MIYENHNKKIFVESYKALNFGDDLFLHILFSRYPNIEFVVFGNKTYMESYSMYKNVTVIHNNVLRLINKAFSLVGVEKIVPNIIASMVDCSILIGGSLFIEPTIPFFRNNYFGDKPLYLLGANYGPACSKEYYIKCVNYLKQFTSCSFRDLSSFYQFEKVLPLCDFAPDIAFCLSEKIKCEEKYLIVCPWGFPGRSKESSEYLNYINIIARAINEHIINGYKVTLIAFCEYEGDSSVNKDIIRKLKSKSNSVSELIYNGINYKEILLELKKSTSIIGSRFHSIVLGLAFGKKVYPLIYSNKTTNMLYDLGIQKKMMTIKNIGPNDEILESDFIELDNNRIEYLKNKADLHFSKFDKYSKNVDKNYEK